MSGLQHAAACTEQGRASAAGPHYTLIASPQTAAHPRTCHAQEDAGAVICGGVRHQVQRRQPRLAAGGDEDEDLEGRGRGRGGEEAAEER